MVHAGDACRWQDGAAVFDGQEGFAGFLAREQVAVGADEAVAGGLGEQEFVFRLAGEDMGNLKLFRRIKAGARRLLSVP